MVTTTDDAGFERLRQKAAELRTRGPRGRYAPSPTGPLHLGNARSALLAWLLTRLQGGTFALRMEDLDQPRVRSGSARQIVQDLRWMGLDWDEGPDVGGPLGPYDQSARDDLYRTALQVLKDRDLVFPCYCSRKDIAQAASAPHGRSPVYPGTCRDLAPDARVAAAARHPDRTPAWRLRVDDALIAMEDGVYGEFSQSMSEDVGDFVLRRADSLFAYQLAVVIDDGLMGITDVLRGFDLLDSSPRQIYLFRVFGFPIPTFWHVPLMLDEAGNRLSKRDGSDSIAQYRDRGVEAPHLVGLLAASIGLVESGRELTARELLHESTLSTFQERLQRVADTHSKNNS